jgi:hypothetical protein
MSDTIQKQQVPFTQIANEVLNSRELSFKAKGIYAFMMSKPDDWNFTIRSMAKQVKDGEDGIKSGIKELKDLGYIEYKKHKNGYGTYLLKVHVSPYDKPKVEKPVKASESLKGDSPRRENPLKGKSTRISNKEPSSNKDSISNKDIHTEQAQNQSEIIDSFFPNEKSTEVLRVLFPKISNRQALDMIEAFKDKMNARKAPWSDIQAQFRTHVRSGWIKPSVIDLTDDEQHKQKGTVSNRSNGQNLISIAKQAEKKGENPWTAEGEVKQSVIDDFKKEELLRLA